MNKYYFAVQQISVHQSSTKKNKDNYYSIIIIFLLLLRLLALAIDLHNNS